MNLDEFKSEITFRTNKELKRDSTLRQGYYSGAEELFEQMYHLMPLDSELAELAIDAGREYVEKQKAACDIIEEEFKKRQKIKGRNEEELNDNDEDAILSSIRLKRDKWADLAANINVDIGTENSDAYVDELLRAESEARKSYMGIVKDAAEVLDVDKMKLELSSLKLFFRDSDFNNVRESYREIMWQRLKDLEAFLGRLLDDDEYKQI
jgi:hypothetical protein